MTTILVSALICAAIYFAVAKLIALGAGWHRLSQAFPSNPNSTPLAEFSNAITQAGAINFRGKSSAGSGAGRVHIQNDGLRIQMSNPFMSDLMVPFERIGTIRISSLLNRTDLRIEISEPTRLHLRLPADAFPHLREKVEESVFEVGPQLNTLRDIYNHVKDAQQEHAG
jgi:hypothetical protein